LHWFYSSGNTLFYFYEISKQVAAKSAQFIATATADTAQLVLILFRDVSEFMQHPLAKPGCVCLAWVMPAGHAGKGTSLARIQYPDTLNGVFEGFVCDGEALTGGAIQGACATVHAADLQIFPNRIFEGSQELFVFRQAIKPFGLRAWAWFWGCCLLFFGNAGQELSSLFGCGLGDETVILGVQHDIHEFFVIRTKAKDAEWQVSSGWQANPHAGTT
jgi:hypothetical protein